MCIMIASPNRACSHLSPNFWCLCKYLIHYQSEDVCACQLSGHVVPSPSQINESNKIMLIVESRMVTMFWALSLVCFEHVSIFYLFLDPHQTTCLPICRYPNYGFVWIRHIYLVDSDIWHESLTHHGHGVKHKNELLQLPRKWKKLQTRCIHLRLRHL